MENDQLLGKSEKSTSNCRSVKFDSDVPFKNSFLNQSWALAVLLNFSILKFFASFAK